jgi:hypothetical protein
MINLRSAYINVIKYLVLVFAVLLCCRSINIAQNKNQVSAANIRVNILEDRNIIYYDLPGMEDEEYEVKIYLVFKQLQDSVLLQSVSGNIGKGVKAGYDRAIIWRFNDEVTLQNKNMESEVEFHIYGFKYPKSSISGNKTIYWIAGGALVLGGGVTWLLLSNKEDNTPKVLPDPKGLGVPPR